MENVQTRTAPSGLINVRVPNDYDAQKLAELVRTYFTPRVRNVSYRVTHTLNLTGALYLKRNEKPEDTDVQLHVEKMRTVTTLYQHKDGLIVGEISLMDEHYQRLVGIEIYRQWNEPTE